MEILDRIVAKKEKPLYKSKIPLPIRYFLLELIPAVFIMMAIIITPTPLAVILRLENEVFNVPSIN